MQPLAIPLVLNAYAQGLFPMADATGNAPTYWVEPRRRAILPLDGLHIARSLSKVVRQDRFRVTADRAFTKVIDLCAAPAPDRAESWINDAIRDCFLRLHAAGHAHSVECWQDDRLVGGLYGLSIGRAFCGESMFSRADNASKVALVWLVARLRLGGYALLDCQFMTDHLRTLGTVEISQKAYLARLHDALDPAAGVPPMAHAAYSALSAAGDSGCAGASSAAAAAGRGAAFSAPDALSFGADWGALDAVLGASLGGATSSSPGKRILQSFTQTS